LRQRTVEREDKGVLHQKLKENPHALKRQFGDAFDRVYASAIFSYSAPKVAELKTHFPEAIVGGTWNVADNRTVESIIGDSNGFEGARVDYDDHAWRWNDKLETWEIRFDASIGFTQRGCRLKCGFCVVPKKEGKPQSVNTIHSIWRGEKTTEDIRRAPSAGHEWPRHLHLLDNDFFGQPREQWEARLDEIRTGGFKVCFNQGINTRMIDDESAKALASVPYYDDSFEKRRLYTAWDSLGDEERFFKGVDCLERHGVPPTHLLVYMLVGYDKRETWERVLYRFERMRERGIKPYPMVYGDRNRTLPSETDDKKLLRKTLAKFQRWGVGRYYMVTSFADYGERREKIEQQTDLFA
jgi:hypothetical protein